MAKFKVGDKCVPVASFTSKCGSYSGEKAEYIIIKAVDSNGRYDYGIYRGVNEVDTCNCFRDEHLTLIKSSSTNMTILEKFALAFKSEPEKSFRKAGITNGDDLLTEEGTEIFLSYLLKKEGTDFKKEVVDLLLEDDKKN